MKKQDDELTLQETEQLCEFFMDCKLSVLQENELRYVLTHVDHHSPLIDDVRQLMGIELTTFNKPFDKVPQIKRGWWSKRATYFSVAASIALLIGIGVSYSHYSPFNQIDNNAYYIAYADGHRLSDDATRAQIEEDLRSAENFMKEMSELEARAKQMNDQFFNN